MNNKFRIIFTLVIAIIMTIVIIATPIVSPALNVIAKKNIMILEIQP